MPVNINKYRSLKILFMVEYLDKGQSISGQLITVNK